MKAIIITDLLVDNPKFYLGNIILARALYSKGEYNESTRYLLKSSDSDLDDFFKYEKYRLLGLCYFYLKNYSSAKEYFLESKKYQVNEASLLLLDDWINKCDFFEKFVNTPAN
jgi:tetratricopeptide (TPR) repeat protein